jgi:hypothetical protein
MALLFCKYVFLYSAAENTVAHSSHVNCKKDICTKNQNLNNINESKIAFNTTKWKDVK